MLGVDTRIESLRRLSGGQIAVAGRIMSDGNRSAGWLMIVSRQGDMIFQRPYARGSQAQLNKVIDDGQGGFYAVGESIPADGGYRAAWVMRLSQSGEPIWQRFLRAKYRYNGSDIALEKDGRAMVLMAGRPAGDGGREHARIVSFSSNGDIVYDESYIEGSNSLPTRLTQHSVTQKRIMAGFAQTGFATDSATEERKLATYDAWIAGLPVLPAYHDPCAPKPAETLDDLQ